MLMPRLMLVSCTVPTEGEVLKEILGHFKTLSMSVASMELSWTTKCLRRKMSRRKKGEMREMCWWWRPIKTSLPQMRENFQAVLAESLYLTTHPPERRATEEVTNPLDLSKTCFSMTRVLG